MGKKLVKNSISITVCLVFTTFLYANTTSAETLTVEEQSSIVEETKEDRVEDIVLTLRIIAGVVFVATVGFFWHTRPSRRLQAAIDRGEIDGTPHHSKKSKYSFHFNIPDDESSRSSNELLAELLEEKPTSETLDKEGLEDV